MVKNRLNGFILLSRHQNIKIILNGIIGELCLKNRKLNLVLYLDICMNNIVIIYKLKNTI